MTTHRPTPAKHARQLVAVIGAIGGTGATTVAAALAAHYADDSHAWLIDLSGRGGGIEMHLGLEETPGIRWPDLAETRGHVAIKALRDTAVTQGPLSLITATRFDTTTPPDQAIDAILTSLHTSTETAIIDCDLTTLTRYQNMWDAIVLVSPLTVLGLGGLLRIHSQLDAYPPTRITTVTTALHAPALTPKEIEQATNTTVCTHLPRLRNLEKAIAIGAGPFHSGRTIQKTLHTTAEHIRKNIDRDRS
ncbi:hypothetical protein [Timonella sp. A28]|uniref:hypothetical protein n=1 Tax=Timonella sp. A28 TaxID=3442640 RepID=UPI003EBDD667